MACKDKWFDVKLPNFYTYIMDTGKVFNVHFVPLREREGLVNRRSTRINVVNSNCSHAITFTF